jgi:hypothetical protein
MRYRIHDNNLSHLIDNLDKLSKKANKLGQTISYKLIDTQTITRKIAGTEDRCKVSVYHNIEVDGTQPIINGYTLIGSVEHLGEDGNLVKFAPGQEIPAEYRNGPATCDHCHADRNRRSTFVVKHEDGTVRRVGRNCLRDFLGHDDPQWIAKIAQIYYDLNEICGAMEDENYSGGGVSKWFNIKYYLSIVAAYIREFGWCSKGMAMEGVGISTANMAAGYCHGTIKRDQMVSEVTDNDKELAINALSWARSLDESGDDLNDYLHNCNVISKGEVVDTKNVGIAASIVASYQRHMNRLAERKARELLEGDSKHVGIVGDRVDMVLNFVSQRSFDGEYGISHLRKFYDIDGNVVIWFGSGSFSAPIKQEGFEDDEDALTFFDPIRPDCWTKVRTTIKAHDEYNGVAQTKVARTNFIDFVSEEDIERHQLGEIDLLAVSTNGRKKVYHGVDFKGVLCGSKSQNIATDDSKITCKSCLKSFDKMKREAEEAKAKREAEEKKDQTTKVWTEAVLSIAKANNIHAVDVLNNPEQEVVKPKAKSKSKKGNLLTDTTRQAEFLVKYPWVKADSFVAGGKGVQVVVICKRCDAESVRNTQDVFQSKQCSDCKKEMRKEKRRNKK